MLVELPEAGQVRLLGKLLGVPMQAVSIGAQVERVFENHNGYALLQWRYRAEPNNEME